MNYLAHLFLTDDSPHGLIGALLPDLVRGSSSGPAHPAIRAAVRLHRRIDAFTDSHYLFVRSRRRLGPEHGFLAGVIVDMFYDHFLAADWSRYSDTPLTDFVTHVYEVFARHTDLMPEQMRPPIQRMIDQDWLGSYATVGGISSRLAQMSAHLAKRLGRPVRMQDAIAALQTNRDALAADFHAFFPLLIDHAQVKMTMVDRAKSRKDDAVSG